MLLSFYISDIFCCCSFYWAVFWNFSFISTIVWILVSLHVPVAEILNLSASQHANENSVIQYRSLCLNHKVDTSGKD